MEENVTNPNEWLSDSNKNFYTMSKSDISD